MTNTQRILQYVYPYRRRLISSLACTGAITGISLIPPLLVKYLVDGVISAGYWDMLPVVILGMMLLPTMIAAIGVLNSSVIAYVSRKLVFDFRLAMYRRLQGLSLRFYDETAAGKIIERIMGDVNAIQQVVTGATIQFVCDVISCTFALGVTFYLSWRLSLLLLLMLPLYLINYHLFVPRLVKNREKYRAKMDDISGVLQERLSSPTMVKSYAREKYETREFVSDTRDSLNVANEGLRYNTSFSATSSVIQNIGSAVIYCAGCYMVVVGAMSYGSVIAFTYYAMNLLAPAVRFSELFNGLQQTKVSVDRILDLLDEQPDVIERPDAIVLEKVRGEVQFDRMSFAYKPGMPVLQDINVTMRPGTVTALVGHTGSGKTTLATLLYRFYDPYAGAIRIDGCDLRDLRLSSLRRHLGGVLQDTIMFNCSIADNVRYGCPAASNEQVVEAAKVAEIHEFVLTLPDGYKTKIGEGGTKLSVGERQRLAIARAVITDPAILVLDEATSSLDTESERAIQKALAKVMRDRTCLVIAHRLSTIVTADQIIVLDKGRVIEVGTHFELMSRPEGHYRELCKQQFSDKVTTAQEDEKTRESLLQTT